MSIDPSAVKWDSPAIDPQSVKWTAPTVEEQKQAAIQDLKNRPWGSGAADAAYKLGGGISDFASRFLPPEAAAGLGSAVPAVVAGAPALLGGSVGKTLTPAFEAGGKWLMQSAVKPTWQAIRTGEASKAIDTLLAEGVNATKGGMEKLRGNIDKLNEQISGAIESSPATVSKGEIGTRLLDTWNKFKNQVNPQADLDAIKQAWLNFRNHPDLAGQQEIPVQVAQKLKQGTYRILADKYGEAGAAATEAQKSLARGLKETISSAVPEVAPLNERASNLLNALNVGERRAFMDPNRNPLNLALLTHNPAEFIGFMADKSALIKSLLARLMHSGQVPALTGMSGGALSGAMQGQAAQGALYNP